MCRLFGRKREAAAASQGGATGLRSPVIIKIGASDLTGSLNDAATFPFGHCSQAFILVRTLWSPLKDLLQLLKNNVFERPYFVVLFEKRPSHDAFCIKDVGRGLRNLPIRVIEVVSVDDLVIHVRENREMQF